MSTQDDIARRSRSNTRLGGFLAGALGTVALALIAGVLFGGGGIGDPDTPPPQVYTNF